MTMKYGFAASVCGFAFTAFAAGPQYDGTMCPIDGGVRIAVEVDSSATAMLIYPTPPGGGYFMTEVAPGQFVHDIQGLDVGDVVSFNFVLQNPQQYNYPPHSLNVAGECVAFERNDVTPPPPRGFRHELDAREGGYWFVFRAGTTGNGIPATTNVIARVRIDGGEFDDVVLLEESPGIFTAPVPAGAGQNVFYWFEQLVGEATVPTVPYERVLGDASVDAPSGPISASTAGRVRHRHPYEWRFDNYVELYDDGRAFELHIAEDGESIDATVVTNPALGVGRVDFKYFIQTDPSVCDRPLTAVNMVMDVDAQQPGVFHHRIPIVTPGAILDIDMTLTDLPESSPVGSYYTDIYYYQVGRGIFSRLPNPRAQPAGPASVPHVVSPRFGFAQHAQGMTMEQLDRFLLGKAIFETDFQTGELLNEPTRFDCCSGPLGFSFDQSPAFQTGLLGPSYTQASCMKCHVQDGRGRLPQDGGDLTSVTFSVGVPGSNALGEPNPHPYYGNQLDIESAVGELPEGRVTLEWEYIDGTFDDGTAYELRRPVYTFRDMAYGSLGLNVPDEFGSSGYKGEATVSARMTPMLTGVGLLDAVSDESILANVDAGDADGDGISGRVNMVWDRTIGAEAIGRFGWKASQPSLLQQTNKAFNRDMGMTTPLYPQQDCGDEQPECDDGSFVPELPMAELQLVEEYLTGLIPPPRINHETSDAIAGMHLFKAANCQACHVPTLQARVDHPIKTYRGLQVEAFTDLLLHDMGPGLADTMQVFGASGTEWRTPPLWALDHVRHALGLPQTCEDPFSGDAEPNFLHDGRARSIIEAILWHGGEAEASRSAVLAMSQQERTQLVAYASYPFPDPIFDGDVEVPCPGDLDDNGAIGLGDLLAIIAGWGQPGPGDLDGSGSVGVNDLLFVLQRYGEVCSG